MTNTTTTGDAISSAKARKAVREDIARQVARFTRIDNDVNGNPRYYIPGYCIERHALAYAKDVLGLVKYLGKQYGAGYETDSITARDTFDAEREQSENLRRIFTRSQLSRLSEIN